MASKRSRRHAFAARSLAERIRMKWEESIVKPTTLASYSKPPAQGSLEKMLHLRAAVNQQRFGKGPSFGRVPPHGNGHQHNLASPLHTNGPHWHTTEKSGPNVLGASKHLGHQRVTAPRLPSWMPSSHEQLWGGPDLPGHPMCAPNNMPGLPVRLGLAGPLPHWGFHAFSASRFTNNRKKQGSS